jgi:hypothetical protein
MARLSERRPAMAEQGARVQSPPAPLVFSLPPPSFDEIEGERARPAVVAG